jgi:hypothetical protein
MLEQIDPTGPFHGDYKKFIVELAKDKKDNGSA